MTKKRATSMRTLSLVGCIAVAILVSMRAGYTRQAQADGIPGYRHVPEKSRFFAGESLARIKPAEENGFLKYRGANGVLAMDLKTGLTFAVQSISQDKSSRTPLPSAPPTPVPNAEEHNKRVVDYFVQSGLPRDQIGQVHANTYLSASGPTSQASFVQPRVDGYASILSRKAADFIVVDSTAWARMDAKGRVIDEWVFWPPLASKVIDDARRLNERLNGTDRGAYLSKLPSTQKTGRVVIRHSSPFAGGDFLAVASYDVTERIESVERSRISVYVRHFDIDGREFRLPQEMRNIGKDYPPKEGAQEIQK